MSLFNKIKNNKINNKITQDKFNKEDVIGEILETKNEKVPGWRFFDIKEVRGPKTSWDFIAIFNATINREISNKENPFSEYKNIVERNYQIVREVYICESEYEREIIGINTHLFQPIVASSTKELFIKLKREQE